MKKQNERGRSRKRKERDNKAKIRLISAAVCVVGLLCLTVLYLHMRQPESEEMDSGIAGKVTANAIQMGGEFPSDETVYYGYQWALHNDGRLRQSNGAGPHGGGAVKAGVEGMDIHIEPAWDIYMQSAARRPVTVALIDTGVDISHPELSDAIWTNPGEIPGDGIDNDSNGYVDDINGWNFCSANPQVFIGEEDTHGTHAAGTIAGRWDGKGITGIADSDYVKIMVLKVLESDEGKGSSENVKAAIRYAEANGAEICNLSIGASEYDPELEELMGNSRMLFVVSAGNGDSRGYGYDLDERPAYPASYPSENIITVSNLMFDGSLYESSNFGRISADLAAPGTYILSTLPYGRYGFMTGTSMAAPMVTGTAALAASCNPQRRMAEIRQDILNSVRKTEGLEGKVASRGILDVYGALAQQSSY